jgi:hypothetical protein
VFFRQTSFVVGIAESAQVFFFFFFFVCFTQCTVQLQDIGKQMAVRMVVGCFCETYREREK